MFRKQISPYKLEAIARELNLNLVKIIVHCSCPKLISSGRRSASEKPRLYRQLDDSTLIVLNDTFGAESSTSRLDISLLTSLVNFLQVTAKTAKIGVFGPALSNQARSSSQFRILYAIIKVCLLMMVEVGIFPSVCGWWIDICSLDFFSHSLKERLDIFRAAPGTTMFLHWMVGMVYIFYFASFVVLVREIIRPGVLWFLRNLNDPDFHPVQEMIQLPVYRHARRFLLSSIIFGMAILIIVWVPARLISTLFPGFLPYIVNRSSDSPMSELSLELILLQVILPAILEQKHTRSVIKGVIEYWILAMARLLSLESYLLGKKAPKATQPNENDAEDPQPAVDGGDGDGDGDGGGGGGGGGGDGGEAPNPPGQGLGDDVHAHLAFQPQGRDFVAFEPYQRPSFFPLRVVCLVTLMALSFVAVSMFLLTVPVASGRIVLRLWFGLSNLHEVYTSATGLYFIWLTTRVCCSFWDWIPQGIQVVRDNMASFLIKASKVIIAFLPLGIAIPFLMGFSFELVFVVPLRVPLYQTPVYFFVQDWAVGILLLKIFCAIVMLGQNNRLKQVIEQVYQDGFVNLRLRFLLSKLALPILTVLLLILCVPYVISVGILPMTKISEDVQNFIYRRIYSYLFIVFMLTSVVAFHVKRLGNFFSHIRNDKYLVGKELVNYQGSGSTVKEQQS